jgi:hypothetical protein
MFERNVREAEGISCDVRDNRQYGEAQRRKGLLRRRILAALLQAVENALAGHPAVYEVAGHYETSPLAPMAALARRRSRRGPRRPTTLKLAIYSVDKTTKTADNAPLTGEMISEIDDALKSRVERTSESLIGAAFPFKTEA